METLVCAMLCCLFTLFLCYFLENLYLRRVEKRCGHYSEQLAFLYQQLEELYGPLVFSLMEARSAAQSREEAHATRLSVSEPRESYASRDTAFNLLALDLDCKQRVEWTARLLTQKSHLLERHNVPDSFQLFLDEQLAWQRARDEQHTSGDQEIWQPRFSWPRQFDQEITAAYFNLRQRHARLLDGDPPH